MRVCSLFFIASGYLVQGFKLHLTSDPNADKTVILFGFSGLRWDSMARGKMPVLAGLAKSGILVLQKRTSFQSETLPAFHTIMTGLYPENHGMISNRMRDTKDGVIFEVGNRELRWWGEAEPLWVTHEKMNPNRTGLCFWPGQDVRYINISLKYTCPLKENGSSYSHPFHELAKTGQMLGKGLPYEERIATVLRWLSEKEPPRFIAMYFEDPFKSASIAGFKSQEVSKALTVIDKLLETFVKELKVRKLFQRINLVITGESGITESLTGKEIYLEDYLPENLKESFDVVDYNGIMSLIPHEIKNVDMLFSKFNGSNRNMVVYTKKSLPNNFHFSHPRRTMPLILVPNEGWRIYPKRVKDPKDKRKAFMGYSGLFPSTHALFVAHGPAFLKKVRLNTMQNVDIYQLLCHALRLEPKPHNGSGYIHTKVVARVDKWYWHVAKTVVRSTSGLTTVIIVCLTLFLLSLYGLVHVIYNAHSRCKCPRRRKMPLVPKKHSYRDIGRDGVKHLLSDEEELSGSDIELGSDLESDVEVKHIQS